MQKTKVYLTPICDTESEYTYTLSEEISNVNSGSEIIIALCEDLEIYSKNIHNAIIEKLIYRTKKLNEQRHGTNILEIALLLNDFKKLSSETINYEDKGQITTFVMPKFSFSTPQNIIQILKINSAKNQLKKVWQIFVTKKTGCNYLVRSSILENYSPFHIVILFCKFLGISESSDIQKVVCRLESQINSCGKKDDIEYMPQLVELLNAFNKLSCETIYDSKGDVLIMPQFNFEIPREILEKAKDYMIRKKTKFILAQNFLIKTEKEHQYNLNKEIKNVHDGQLVIKVLCKDLDITNDEAVSLVVLKLDHEINLYNKTHCGKDIIELIGLLNAFRNLSSKEITCRTQEEICKMKMPKFSFEIPDEMFDEAAMHLRYWESAYSIGSIFGKFLIKIEDQENQYELKARIARINLTGETIVTLLSKDLGIKADATVEMIMSNLNSQISLYNEKPLSQRIPELISLLDAFKTLSGKTITIERSEYSEVFLIQEFNFEIPQSILEEATIEIERRQRLENKSEKAQNIFNIFHKNKDNFQKLLTDGIGNIVEEQKEAIASLEDLLDKSSNENREICQEKIVILKKNIAFMKFIEEVCSVLPELVQISKSTGWVQLNSANEQHSHNESLDRL